MSRPPFHPTKVQTVGKKINYYPLVTLVLHQITGNTTCLTSSVRRPDPTENTLLRVFKSRKLNNIEPMILQVHYKQYTTFSLPTAFWKVKIWRNTLSPPFTRIKQKFSGSGIHHNLCGKIHRGDTDREFRNSIKPDRVPTDQAGWWWIADCHPERKW